MTEPAVAMVTRAGTLEEVDDRRGVALLRAHPELVAWARALLECDAGALRFTWIGPASQWHAVAVERAVDHSRGDAARVEIVETEPSCALSARELDVLTLLAGGLSNPEIAAHLSMRPRTVAKHVERILGKLEVTTRAGAAAIAVERGLLRLPVPGGGRSVETLAVGRVDQHAAGRLRPVVADPAPRRRPRPYLLGSAIPSGGPLGGDGRQMLQGSRLRVDEINAHGGIAGRRIEQVVVDLDVTARDGLREAFRALVDREVDAIAMGYAFADEPSAYTDVVAYGCPVLNVMTSEAQAQRAAADPTAYGRIFQTGPTEIQYGIGFVRFLDSLVARGDWCPSGRGLAFVESDMAGGRTASRQVLDAAERSRWETRTVECVRWAGADWDAVLAMLHDTSPDAAMITHFDPAELAAFQRAFAASPTDTLLYATYTPSVPGFLERAGAGAEGLVWATLTGTHVDPLASRFIAGYRATFGEPPGPALAGVGYDQVWLLATAWAGVGNPRAFGEVAASLCRGPFRGVNGSYHFGHPRRCALSWPSETPDPSFGQAQHVFQIVGGEHRLIAPEEFAVARFTPRHAQLCER